MTETHAPAGARIERPLAEWRWDAAVAVFVGGAAALLVAGYVGDPDGPEMDSRVAVAEVGWVCVVAALLSFRAADLVSAETAERVARLGFRASLLAALISGLVTALGAATLGGLGGLVLSMFRDVSIWSSASGGLLAGLCVGGAAGVLFILLQCVGAALVALRGGPAAPRTWLAVPRDVALLALASVVVGSASATFAALRFLDLSTFGGADLAVPGPAVLLAIATVLRAKQGPGPLQFTR